MSRAPDTNHLVLWTSLWKSAIEPGTCKNTMALTILFWDRTKEVMGSGWVQGFGGPEASLEWDTCPFKDWLAEVQKGTATLANLIHPHYAVGVGRLKNWTYSKECLLKKFEPDISRKWTPWNVEILAKQIHELKKIVHKWTTTLAVLLKRAWASLEVLLLDSVDLFQLKILAPAWMPVLVWRVKITNQTEQSKQRSSNCSSKMTNHVSSHNLKHMLWQKFAELWAVPQTPTTLCCEHPCENQQLNQVLVKILWPWQFCFGIGPRK